MLEYILCRCVCPVCGERKVSKKILNKNDPICNHGNSRAACKNRINKEFRDRLIDRAEQFASNVNQLKASIEDLEQLEQNPKQDGPDPSQPEIPFERKATRREVVTSQINQLLEQLQTDQEYFFSSEALENQNLPFIIDALGLTAETSDYLVSPLDE